MSYVHSPNSKEDKLNVPTTKRIATTLATALVAGGAAFATAAPASAAQTATYQYSHRYYSTCEKQISNYAQSVVKAGQKVLKVGKCIQDPGTPYLFRGYVTHTTP